ncbi:MAG: IS200/IS605 family transposase [Phycisphaerae bacterium]
MSYTSLIYHIVYSTKNRQPWLRGDVLSRVIGYTGGVIRNLGGTLLKAGGAADHMHLLVGLPPVRPLANIVRDMKSNSSKWIHRELADMGGFAWQDQYSAFSVSRSAQQRVAKYIDGQAEHHKTMDFIDELRALLDRHGVEYNPEYLV